MICWLSTACATFSVSTLKPVGTPMADRITLAGLAGACGSGEGSVGRYGDSGTTGSSARAASAAA